MAQQTRNWFFVVTAQPGQAGTRLRTNDKPTTQTFQALLDSVPFFKEQTSRGEFEDYQAPATATQHGLVVISSPTAALNRDSSLTSSGHQRVVAPYQLPTIAVGSGLQVAATSENVTVQGTSRARRVWTIKLNPERTDYPIVLTDLSVQGTLPVVNALGTSTFSVVKIGKLWYWKLFLKDLGGNGIIKRLLVDLAQVIPGNTFNLSNPVIGYEFESSFGTDDRLVIVEPLMTTNTIQIIDTTGTLGNLNLANQWTQNAMIYRAGGVLFID